MYLNGMFFELLVFYQNNFIFFLSLRAIGLIGITKSAFEPFLSDKIHRILHTDEDTRGGKVPPTYKNNVEHRANYDLFTG